jgi:hypothetical protein
MPRALKTRIATQTTNSRIISGFIVATFDAADRVDV